VIQPVMTGEQSNIPQNEEELAAALNKKQRADAVEAAAHEAARSAPRQERVALTSHGVLTAMWEHAEATGTLAHHINALLFTVAVIVANAKTHAEEVRVFEYIEKTASELKAKRPTIGER
jgi:hypothetical protein